MADRQVFLHARIDRANQLVTDAVRGTVVLYKSLQMATTACEDGERVVMLRCRYNIPAPK